MILFKDMLTYLGLYCRKALILTLFFVDPGIIIQINRIIISYKILLLKKLIINSFMDILVTLKELLHSLKL